MKRNPTSLTFRTLRAMCVPALCLVAGGSFRPLQAATGPAETPPLPAELSQPLPAQPPFTREVLPNGVTLIVQPSGFSDVVGMEVVSRVGTRYEDSARAGLASMTLRVMTDGTHSWTGEAIKNWFEDRGSSLEARAHPDYSEIGSSVVSAQWTAMAGIFASLISEASLATESFTSMQQSMLNEVQSSARSEEAATYSDLRTLIAGETAYGRSETGGVQSLVRLTSADVSGSYGKMFAPSALVVVVSGNVKADAALVTLRTLFGHLRAGAPLLPPPGSPSMVREPASLVTAGYGDEAWIMVGYPTPGVMDDGYAAASVLNAIIGGSNSGILASHFRDQAGVYESGSFLQPFSYQTHIAGYVRADPLLWDQQVQKMRPLVDRYQKDLTAIFASLQQHGATTEQVNIARQFVIGDYLRAHERSRARAGYLGWYEAIGLGAGFDDQFLRKVQAVTPDAVNRLAARCFQAPRGATVVMFPQPRADGQ